MELSFVLSALTWFFQAECPAAAPAIAPFFTSGLLDEGIFLSVSFSLLYMLCISDFSFQFLTPLAIVPLKLFML